MNEILKRLDVFIGAWSTEAALDGVPVGRGHATFACDGAFLRMYEQDEPPLPTTPTSWLGSSPSPVAAVFGLDDQGETFHMLYADERGVLRVYRSTLAGGVWTIWREAPGFHQRYTGTFSSDARTITGRWEGSPDGRSWSTDFALTYRRMS